MSNLKFCQVLESITLIMVVGIITIATVYFEDHNLNYHCQPVFVINFHGTLIETLPISYI